MYIVQLSLPSVFLPCGAGIIGKSAGRYNNPQSFLQFEEPHLCGSSQCYAYCVLLSDSAGRSHLRLFFLAFTTYRATPPIPITQTAIMPIHRPMLALSPVLGVVQGLLLL